MRIHRRNGYFVIATYYRLPPKLIHHALGLKNESFGSPIRPQYVFQRLLLEKGDVAILNNIEPPRSKRVGRQALEA